MSVMMKTSGIEWIGDIPENWNIDKLYRLTDLVSSGGTPTSTNPDYYEGDIVWIQTGDLNDGYVAETSKTITQYGLENSSAKIFEQGTLLMAMYGATIGKLGIMTMNAATNQACCAMKYDIKTDTKFMYYIFLAMRTHLINQSYGGGQPNISQEVIKQQYLCFPKKDEQQAIASFLDHATAKIDYVIKTKQTQLKTLETLKKSIIHKAVTEGLDTSVTMKDSGVEWIGDIPRAWEVRRIKSFADYVSRGNSPTYDDDGSIKVVNQSCVYSDALKYEKLKVNQDEDISDFKGKLQQYDLLINSTGTGTLGRTGVFLLDADNYIADGHVTIVRDSYGRLNPFYLNYIFYDKQDMFSEAYALGATNQIELQREKFRTISAPYPSLSEQQAIVNFLDNEAEKINILKANVQKQINLLKEYKKSLIYEYVTGKKQVKE